jgi:predicted metal-dependent enzyme (double-stranded beta helix superfamily)
MVTTPITPDLQRFIDDVGLVVAGTDDQYEITERVAPLLAALLASGYRLPPAFVQPSPDRHLNYPLYLAPDDSWCLVVVVWNVGQRTPVHGHETWGVVGIYSGAEREIRYVKPTGSSAGKALTPAGEQQWERGQVTVCCTTDDDVHSVVAVGDEPTIGIHIYGGNIGTLNRPSYDPATGAVHWFVSGWDQPLVHSNSEA